MLLETTGQKPGESRWERAALAFSRACRKSL